MQLTMKDGFPPSHKVFCVAWKLNVPADPQKNKNEKKYPKGGKNHIHIYNVQSEKENED